MKDKLVKLNRKRIDPLLVIKSCQCEDTFYKWLIKRDPLRNGKVYSLKRLAKEFLAEFPGFYDCYEQRWNSNLEETIRIAKTPWLDED